MIPRRRVSASWSELANLLRQAGKPAGRDPGVIASWEKEVAGFVGCPYAAAVNSGRRAMMLILRHLGIGDGDEIIIPAYTLKDLIPLIQRTGAAVIPADIDPATFNVSPEAILRRITPKTKAILALHAFGAPCRIEQIVSEAQPRSIPVIEDCAHSLGASVRGKSAGSFGYAGFFSFETTKPVNTYGGGMVVTKDPALIETVRKATASGDSDLGSIRKKIRAVRTERLLFATRLSFPTLYLLASPVSRGMVHRLYRRMQHAPPADTRYAPMQAEIGLQQIGGLGDRIEQRKQRVSLLRSRLKEGLHVQHVERGCESSWYFCVVRLPRAAGKIRRRLLLRGIDAGVEDEIADNCAGYLGFADCPVVDDVYPRAIALPMYDGISQQAVERVARTLNNVV